jgi:hypothetical protein
MVQQLFFAVHFLMNLIVVYFDCQHCSAVFCAGRRDFLCELLALLVVESLSFVVDWITKIDGHLLNRKVKFNKPITAL